MGELNHVKRGADGQRRQLVVRIVLAGVAVERRERGHGLQVREQEFVECVVEHGV